MQLVTDSFRPAAKGEIRIDSFREEFYSPLEVWRCEDYEEQWQQALRRLADGAPGSCFVTGVHPPEIAAFIDTYSAWLVGLEYHFQEHYLFFDDLGVVDPRDPYNAIGEHRTQTEDGDRIYDDWSIPRTAFSI